MTEIVRHFSDANDNNFAATFDSQELANLYIVPDGATEIPDPPSLDHMWETDQWVLPAALTEAEEAAITQLTRRQVRMALISDGKSASFVSDLIDAMPEGPAKEAAKVDWEDAPNYQRSHPLVVSLLGAAGYTSAEADTLWIAAKDLPL